jgi:hypothetical protein
MAEARPFDVTLPAHSPAERQRSRRERRRHPRAITDLSATLVVAGSAYPARVINLSMGGALLDLAGAPHQLPVKVGDALAVEIRCRGRGRGGPLHVTAKAVLWNTSSARVPLLAVQFDDVTGTSLDQLEDLMIEALSHLRGRALAALL